MQSLQNEDIEATLKTADDLWAAYRVKRKDPTFAQKNVTEKIGHFQSLGFSNFITKYAVPTRYMVMYDEYSHHAFLKYLLRLKTVGYKSKDEWIERQADYVKFLWRAYNPRGSAKEAGEAHYGAYDSIKKEMDGFENDYDKAKVKAEDRRRTAISDNRQALIDMLDDQLFAARLSAVQLSMENAAEPVADEPVQVAVPVADEPVQVAVPPTKVLTDTQRRNAVRRHKDKIKKALAAVPEVKQKTAQEVWLAEHVADKEKKREARRKHQALAKVLEREAEKDRLRKKWEETRSKLTGNSNTEPDIDVPEDDETVDLSD